MTSDIVEDRNGILAQQDHQRAMDRLEMTVVGIDHPMPSVARITGRIAPVDPRAWMPANLAVRMEVETHADAPPTSRVYTIRHFDPATSTVEVDFVIHPDDSPAMRWLRSATAGTRIWMTGPRQHFTPNHDGKAAVFADETAIPAVYAILREWPAGAAGHIWIETTDKAAFDELPHVEGVGRTLILRDGAAGVTMNLLPVARTLGPEWTVWAAGERREMREIRNHCLANGMSRDNARVFGYWRHGTSSSEIDRARLNKYETLRQKGLNMDEMDDTDLSL